MYREEVLKQLSDYRCFSGRQHDTVFRDNWRRSLHSLSQHVSVVGSTARNWFHAKAWRQR